MKDEPDNPTEQDRQALVVDEIDPSNAKVLTGVRLIIEASANPAVRFDTKALAKATGLSEWWVGQVLRSQEFSNLIMDQAQIRVSGALMRVVDKIAAKVEDKDASLNALALAGRFLNDTMRTLNQAGAAPEIVDRQQAATALVEKARGIAKIKRANYRVLQPERIEESK